MSSKFFWRSPERRWAWHICDWDEEAKQPVNEGSRLAVIADAVDYLGFDRLSGEIVQFLRPHGRVRITGDVIVDSHLQLNVGAAVSQAGEPTVLSITAVASLDGDFPYGLVKIQGFIVNKIEKEVASEFVYTQ
jgi:hypothetical protein